MDVAFQLFVEVIALGFAETVEFCQGFFHEAAQEDPFIFIQFVGAGRDGIGHSDGHFQVFEIGSVGGNFLQIIHVGFHQLMVYAHITGIVQRFQIDVAVYLTAQDIVVEDFSQFEFFFFIPQGHLYIQVE